MSKSDARFELRLPSELLRQLDAARGDESRAGFVKRAVEEKLARRAGGSGWSETDLQEFERKADAAVLVRAQETGARPVAAPRYRPKREVKPIPKGDK